MNAESGRARAVRSAAEVFDQLPLACAALLEPVALLAFIAGLWRVGADMRFTRPFLISYGLFSHWQVWLAVAVSLQAAVLWLNRAARERRIPHFGRLRAERAIEIGIAGGELQSDYDPRHN